MIKKALLSSSLVVVLLCGPAVADVPTVRAPTQAVDVSLTVHAGAQQRHYVVKLVNDSCGSISNKTAATSEDAIQLCSSEDGSQLKLNVDWMTRDGQRELHSKSTVLVKRGATFEIEGDGAKLTVAVK